jgi:hypothetical protein
VVEIGLHASSAGVRSGSPIPERSCRRIPRRIRPRRARSLPVHRSRGASRETERRERSASTCWSKGDSASRSPRCSAPSVLPRRSSPSRSRWPPRPLRPSPDAGVIADQAVGGQGRRILRCRCSNNRPRRASWIPSTRRCDGSGSRGRRTSGGRPTCRRQDRRFHRCSPAHCPCHPRRSSWIPSTRRCGRHAGTAHRRSRWTARCRAPRRRIPPGVPARRSPCHRMPPRSRLRYWGADQWWSWATRCRYSGS